MGAQEGRAAWSLPQCLSRSPPTPWGSSSGRPSGKTARTRATLRSTPNSRIGTAILSTATSASTSTPTAVGGWVPGHLWWCSRPASRLQPCIMAHSVTSRQPRSLLRRTGKEATRPTRCPSELGAISCIHYTLHLNLLVSYSSYTRLHHFQLQHSYPIG